MACANLPRRKSQKSRLMGIPYVSRQRGLWYKRSIRRPNANDLREGNELLAADALTKLPGGHSRALALMATVASIALVTVPRFLS